MSAAASVVSHTDLSDSSIVVVGSGPVGMRTVQELLRHGVQRPIVLCGAEDREPYNRVALSSFLMGELGLDELTRDLRLPDADNVQRHLGCPVTAIDRNRRRIVDARGRIWPYATLVLALGSAPHIPNIPNVRLPGVYTFRDFRDAELLFARRVRSRRTVVLGGGLLGLEAARAMRRFNTAVTIVEHNERLMARQLDSLAAEVVKQHVEVMGIDVVLGDGVRSVEGGLRVDGLTLQSGRRLDCDTVIVATGIRPNIDLARSCSLHVGRGIRIDDFARTSDADIYAVGECAEHRGVVYGLVAPGFEQASVAAANIAGVEARYQGSLAATQLKVVGLPVFSVGCVSEDERLDHHRLSRFRSPDGRSCATVVMERGRLIGASVVGRSEDAGRLQEAVRRRCVVWFWQRWRHRRSGVLWPALGANEVAHWPATSIVCNCTGVTRGRLTHTIAGGCANVVSLSACTGAGSVCGSCRPLLQQLIGNAQPLPPVRGSRMLAALGIVAAMVALWLALRWNLPESRSVQDTFQLSRWWRDPGLKQLTGYSLLALSALTLLLSLRKRVRRFRWGDFPLWRLVHVGVGVLCAGALLMHTGGRMGSNLNFILAASFTGLVLLGAAAGVVTAGEHRLGARAATLRRRSVWIHILLFWPVPVLLGFHILQSYFF